MTLIDAKPIHVFSNLNDEPDRTDIEETAYQEVLTAIFEQRLLPGTKLGEEWLAKNFHISRARVRRILLRLVQDRMVTQHPHRGAYVAEPTLAEARDLMQARRAVEEKIVTIVCSTITSSDTAELRALIGHETRARKQGDHIISLRAGCDFHLKLAEFSGNFVLYEIIRDLVLRSSLVEAQKRDLHCPVCPADDHPGILDAISDGDAGRAVAVMDEHLRNVERTLWHHEDGRRHGKGIGRE